MKIFLYIRACIKIIPWKFRILNPTNAWGVIYLWSSHFFFLKSRPLFNAFRCFYMFANKHFVYIKCACFKKRKVLQWEICNILFFMWRRIHCKIFISALVALMKNLANVSQRSMRGAVHIIIVWTPTPFLSEGGGVNFDYYPQRGASEKYKKASGSMVQGHVFLKGKGWVALFLLNLFKVYQFYI